MQRLKWVAIAINVAFCAAVLAGSLLGGRRSGRYWPVLVLLSLSFLGMAALIWVDRRPLYLVALVVSLAFGILGVFGLLFVLFVSPANYLSSRGVFVYAVSIMVFVPLVTALALVKLRRSIA